MKTSLKKIKAVDVIKYTIIAVIIIAVGYMIINHGFDNGYHRG